MIVARSSLFSDSISSVMMHVSLRSRMRAVRRRWGWVTNWVCAGPAVSVLAPTNTPQTTGGTLTISGLDFGAFELTATASLEYEADHTCSSASWTSSTVVACAVRGQGYRAGLGAYITVATVAGTQSAAFSFDGERALTTDCV